jgi:hypothetical protein
MYNLGTGYLTAIIHLVPQYPGTSVVIGTGIAVATYLLS